MGRLIHHRPPPRRNFPYLPARLSTAKTVISFWNQAAFHTFHAFHRSNPARVRVRASAEMFFSRACYFSPARTPVESMESMEGSASLLGKPAFHDLESRPKCWKVAP